MWKHPFKYSAEWNQQKKSLIQKSAVWVRGRWSCLSSTSTMCSIIMPRSNLPWMTGSMWLYRRFIWFAETCNVHGPVSDKCVSVWDRGTVEGDKTVDGHIHTHRLAAHTQFIQKTIKALWQFQLQKIDAGVNKRLNLSESRDAEYSHNFLLSHCSKVMDKEVRSRCCILCVW